jgi:hypothetical protein
VRLDHRNHASSWFAVPVSDYVDPEYEAKVQQATQSAEREYRKAGERLKRAEERLAAAQRKQQNRRQVRQLQELVKLRRIELEEYERLMTPAHVATDKQIRQRTGLDDHLELGEYKRPEPRHVPPGPVTRSRRRPDNTAS